MKVKQWRPRAGDVYVEAAIEVAGWAAAPSGDVWSVTHVATGAAAFFTADRQSAVDGAKALGADAPHFSPGADATMGPRGAIPAGKHSSRVGAVRQMVEATRRRVQGFY